MPKPNDTPVGLRPYIFHGLLLDRNGNGQATGDCPFCGKEGKFGVDETTGEARCWSCQVAGEGGKQLGLNQFSFLRRLWELSEARTDGELVELADERGYLSPDALTAWGIVRSALTGEWLAPGYNGAGKLVQLYRYVSGPKGRILMTTPGPDLHHQLFGMNLYDASKPQVWLCEGPWDAVALWEVLRLTRLTADGSVEFTESETSSLAAEINVLAVPGCSTFKEEWTKYLADKVVTLAYDSDHSRIEDGVEKGLQGWRGMKRTAAILAAAKEPPSEVRFVRWGPEGFDPQVKDGFDVRDFLSGAGSVEERVAALGELFAKVESIPDDWGPAEPKPEAVPGASPALTSVPCYSWRELGTAWRKAMQWRQGLDDVLSVMLSVALSTNQKGRSQLFLQVIGDAGSGKTQFCDAMLTSKYCYALEHLSGFHSGWKGSGEEANDDFSLLSRVNGKTMITPEGDVLMSSPKFVEIMSQQRRIFDGVSGASYKNRKEDLRWTGLRTPWIMAGTPALLETDQSRLGDRFLRVCVDKPSVDERRDILRRVGMQEHLDVRELSNCVAGGLGKTLVEAYRLTGGYVDHLRERSTELLEQVETDEDYLIDRCLPLAEFVADLRARPNPDPRKDLEPTKELPSRLMSQLVRLANCLTAVLGKRKVDAEVMRRVRCVALDTARGKSMDICRLIAGRGPKGLTEPQIVALTGDRKDRIEQMLRFLTSIEVLQRVERKVNPVAVAQVYLLSKRTKLLWKAIIGNSVPQE